MPVKDNPVEFTFPFCGIDLSGPFDEQKAAQMQDESWGHTCASGINVRAYEGLTGKIRGGSRQFLKKYVAAPVVFNWVVQDLNVLTKGGTMQGSSSGRVVTLVAVSQGDVYTAKSGDTQWTVATNSTGTTPPLNYTGIVRSTALNQKMWFADGTNWCYLDPSVNTVFPWNASAGSLPADSLGNKPRLICTWRGRIVLSGLLYDPQNWFMAAQLDPTNFDYAPNPTLSTQAVVGNNSPAGTIGDVVTGLAPYNDDTLFMFGDHSIYLFKGDPMAGGQIDLVTDAIGGAWGIPWAKDPYGNIYFLSNRAAIYIMTPGQMPQRISQQVEQILQGYSLDETTVRLQWNDEQQGLHVFLTPTAAAATTYHLFWEWRTGGWFQDLFASSQFDPLCCCVFDGNEPGDRVGVIGSWDGYVRTFDSDALNDDGTAVTSSVVIGPLVTKQLDMMLLNNLQAVLGETSGNVNYAIYIGKTAEAALSSSPIKTGTWSSSRNNSTLIRRSGHAVYVKLTSTDRWAIERIRGMVQTQGTVQRRGK